MFRIKTIFENPLTVILKIEGAISDESLQDWAAAIKRALRTPGKQTILEICQVSYISPKAVETLAREVSGDTYLMNCPVFVTNMLLSAGLSGHLLD